MARRVPVRRWLLSCCLAIGLSWLALIRTEGFSLEAISGPPFARDSLTFEWAGALKQTYHFLNKGRQSYVFVSEDGKTVIKFFIQRYHQLPWYFSFLPWKERERSKRQLREYFYHHSYLLAAELFPEESGLLYIHFGLAKESLPILNLVDKASRCFRVDLMSVPFVLQRRGEPFYPYLQSLTKQELERMIDAFLTQISHRIERGVADQDHDVEHNFGVWRGQLLHLDPGRLYLDENLKDPERLKFEWWSATHQFRSWLEDHRPEAITFFEERLHGLQLWKEKRSQSSKQGCL